jgi:hypothetical protein
MQNLFKSNFTIPNDTICICGSGNNANDNYGKVKDDFFKIACNAAIGMPLKFDAWGIADDRVMEHEYFQKYSKEFQGIYFIGHSLVKNFPIKNDNVYVFNQSKGISSKDPHYKLEHDTIKMGGTVAGCMMQLAYWCTRDLYKEVAVESGSETIMGMESVLPKIRLLGVQLTGGTYFDGTQGRNFDEFYAVRKALNKMVKYMVDELGCDIKSLNETFLDVPVI